VNIESFKMLDFISNISVGDGSIECSTQVPKISSIFDHHFPNFPVVPGVLLIEVMAQSSGYAIMAHTEFSKLPVLAKVSNCKFVDFVSPGDLVTCKSNLIKCCIGVTLNKAELFIGQRQVASAEIRLRLVDFPSDSAKQTLEHNFNMLLSKGKSLIEEVAPCSKVANY